ncbi:MAG TPA: hypothetical protein VLL52_19835, partial [Anaerolineae bacterium]|nr:hypothetical protein [Anaerolineae bacterium]
MTPNTPPFADGQVGLHVLRAFAQSPSPLTALATMQQHLGELFQITLPGFQPIVAAGPNVNRQILLDQRDDLLWRPPHDPVTKLLRHGLLVTDGTQHQQLRAVMEPTMHKQQVLGHISKMRYYTDWVIDRWPTNKPVDMLIAMRQVALLILVGTLFGIDYT